MTLLLISNVSGGKSLGHLSDFGILNPSQYLPSKLQSYIAAAIAAVGTVRLNPLWSGMCAQVKVGDTLTDIPFDANGHISTTALLAAAGSSDAIVTALYDQSGAGNHATRAIATTGSGNGIVVDLTSGGSGYTSAPAVSIANAGGGTGFAATATVANGKVTGVNITAVGSGYTGTPTAVFTGGGGTGATATAIIGGARQPLIVEAGVVVTDTVNGLPALKMGGSSDSQLSRKIALTVDLPASGFSMLSATRQAGTSSSSAIGNFTQASPNSGLATASYEYSGGAHTGSRTTIGIAGTNYQTPIEYPAATGFIEAVSFGNGTLLRGVNGGAPDSLAAAYNAHGPQIVMGGVRPSSSTPNTVTVQSLIASTALQLDAAGMATMSGALNTLLAGSGSYY